jgi:diguanylate cyclase
MSTVSRRTWAIGAVGLIATAVLEALVVMKAGGAALEVYIGNAPLNLTTGAAAVVVIWAALQFASGVPIRRQWMLIGLGAASFCVGNLIWTAYQVMGLEPFPSLADVGYVLLYPLMAVGIWGAALGFRRLFDVKLPLAIGALVAGIASVSLYFGLFQTIVTDTETSALGKLLSIFYPLGDMWLLLLPAIAIAIIATRMSGGRIAWPWYAACVGLAFIAAGDTLFAVTNWNGTYTAGSYVDVIWCVGYVALAVAASILVDVQKPKAASAPDAGLTKGGGAE